MSATAMRFGRGMSALTEDVYEPNWEIPALSSAAFSSTKNSLLVNQLAAPRIVVTISKEPIWFKATLNALKTLLNLQDNWDSYGASKPQETAVMQGLKLLWQVMANNSPAPGVVPLSDGGIQFEWHRNNQDLEITFSVEDVPTFYWQDLALNEEKEGPAAEISLIASLVKGLS